MTTREDVKSAETEMVEFDALEAEEFGPAGRLPSGRIVHDERGNAVWKWGGDTSATDSTPGVLEEVDPTDLTVEGSGPGRSSGGRAPVFDAGGGYDPYNQGTPRIKTGVPKSGGRGKP